MVRSNKQNDPRPSRVEQPSTSTSEAPSESSASADAGTTESSGGPIRASFKSDGKGGGILQLRYTGQLAGFSPIWVRLGERRGGSDWVKTRDVQMDKSGSQATARITFAPGDQVEGASFAFFTVRDGHEQVWDNAGRPYGCYVLDTKTGEVATR